MQNFIFNFAKILLYILTVLVFLLVAFLGFVYTNLQAKAETTINYQFIYPENTITVDQKIEVACFTFGCDAVQLKRVMLCESGGNPNAINRKEPGQPSGLFQYKMRTWLWMSDLAGIPNANIWDTDSQIYTTSFIFGQRPDLKNHWTCK